MCANWFLKQSCLLSPPLKHKHPRTKTLITPPHRQLATHRGQDEYLSHHPTQGRNNAPRRWTVLSCSSVEVSSWQPPSDCATVMWKAERGPLGSQRGGVEMHKWHSGSCSAVTRWILHTGAAVSRVLAGPDPGRWVGKGSLVGLQCAWGGGGY